MNTLSLSGAPTDVSLYIDPGKAHCGWACFALATGTLVRAGVERVRPPTRTTITGRGMRVGTHGQIDPTVSTVILPARLAASLRDLHVVHMLTELPQVYVGGHTKDPRALMYLATTAGAIAGRIQPATTRFVEPREWKGQVPDEVFWRRVRRALDDDERTIAVEAGVYQQDGKLGGQFHHGLEAIGLGLWSHLRL